jgi:hypothetical protein
MKTRILPVVLVLLLGAAGAARAQVDQGPAPRPAPNGTVNGAPNGTQPYNGVVPPGAAALNGCGTGCNGCGADGCWPNRHGNGSCLHRLLDWLCYRPQRTCVCRHGCTCECLLPNYYYFLPACAFQNGYWPPPEVWTAPRYVPD